MTAAEYVERMLATAPPLSDDTIHRLVDLLPAPAPDQVDDLTDDDTERAA